MGRLALARQMEMEEEEELQEEEIEVQEIEVQEMEEMEEMEELQYVGIDEGDREILDMEFGDIEEPAVEQLQYPVVQPQPPALQIQQAQQVLQMLLSPLLGLPQQLSPILGLP